MGKLWAKQDFLLALARDCERRHSLRRIPIRLNTSICIDHLTDSYPLQDYSKIDLQVILFNIQINTVNSLFH